MSFSRYPEYKDSGVEWLGDVPAHWLVTPLKRFGRLKGGAGFPHESQGIEGEELDFHKVNALGSANSIGMLLPSENTISLNTAKKLGAYVFPSGTIVFAKVGAALLLGRIRELSSPACIDNNMMGLVVTDSSISVRFLRYAMSLVRFDLISNPGAVPSLNEGQIGNFTIVSPSSFEQVSIAKFLDAETLKIDGLISEQEELITLLKEKRQAVISHAVTKGLDPNVPMKDSGIEWIGEVPAHWSVLRLKFALSSIKAGPFGSALTKDMYAAKGYRVYGQEQVIAGDFEIGDYFICAERYAELKQYEVLPRDILVSCVGTFGKIAVAPENIAPGIINPRLIRLRTASDVCSEYLCEVLRSQVVYEQLSLLSRGGTMDVINIGTLNDIWIAVPDREEQSAIIEYIKSMNFHFSELIEEAGSGIEILKERRSALISAAVTGKIDVRMASSAEAE